MEYVFFLFVFVCGLIVKFVGILFLVGYLLVGFLLNIVGYIFIDEFIIIVNLGIMIMFFIIGLKFNICDLSKCEVWVGSLSYILFWVIVIIGVVYGVVVFVS